MEATLTAALLLKDGDVTDLGTDSVRPRLDVQVPETVLDLLSWHIFKSVAKGCFLIEWVVSVVVALRNALIVTLADLWDQVCHDLPEEFHWINRLYRFQGSCASTVRLAPSC